MFNRNPDSPTIYPFRILKTHLPKRTKNYVEIVQWNFQKKHLLQDAQKLQKIAQEKGVWNNELEQKYEHIDKTGTAIMLKVEKKCAPKYPPLVHLSSKLLHHGSKLRYLFLYRAYLLEKKNLTTTHLEKQAQRAGIPHQSRPLNQIQDEITEVRMQLRKIRKQHNKEIKQFLQQLSEEYFQNCNLYAQHILQTIIEGEHI